MPIATASPDLSVEPPDATDEDDGSGSGRAGRIVAVVIVLAMVILWAMAFAGYGKKPDVDILNDPKFTDAAEKICADMQEQVNALPSAGTAATPEQRAQLVDEGNAIMRTHLSDLEALPADKPETNQPVQLWLADYEQHLSDRARFARRLRTGDDTPFTETSHNGKGISRSIDRFARINDMESCKTPDDV